MMHLSRETKQVLAFGSPGLIFVCGHQIHVLSSFMPGVSIFVCFSSFLRNGLVWSGLV